MLNRHVRSSVVLVAALVGTGVLAWSFSGSDAAGPAAAIAAPAAAPAPAASGSFDVNLIHSSALFKIKYLNATNFYGTFNTFSGDFTIGDTASINVSVDAASVDSRNEGRNKHITGPDFFNAKEFPKITFKAAGLKPVAAGGAWSGTGDLTFRGVTKPVTFTLTQTGTGTSREKKNVVGVETSIKIKRTDFGNDYMIGPLSDEVEIIVALEGVAK
jgi:polyisoprenoid-binding protein YceI